MRKERVKETDVAAWADSWLRAQGFETWYEVPITGGRADIIAVRQSVLWIVECKSAMSLDFVMQLHDRLGERCHGVLGVLPLDAYRHDRLAQRLLVPFGIGMLAVTSYTGRIRYWPHLRRLNAGKLRSKLRDEYRRGVPGSQSSYWTPFKSLVAELQRELVEGPIATAATLRCLTEYRDRPAAAQRRALADYLERGLVPGWGIERREGRLYVVRREAS